MSILTHTIIILIDLYGASLLYRLTATTDEQFSKSRFNLILAFIYVLAAVHVVIVCFYLRSRGPWCKVTSLGNLPLVKIWWTTLECWSTDCAKRRLQTWRPGGMVWGTRYGRHWRWSWTSIPPLWRKRENGVRQTTREHYVPNCRSIGPRSKSSIHLCKNSRVVI